MPLPNVEWVNEPWLANICFCTVYYNPSQFTPAMKTKREEKEWTQKQNSSNMLDSVVNIIKATQYVNIFVEEL